MKRYLKATIIAAALVATGAARADDAPMDWLFGDRLGLFQHGTELSAQDAWALRAQAESEFAARINAIDAQGGCNADFLPFYVAWNCGGSTSWAALIRRGN